MCTGQPIGASPMAVERKGTFSSGMAGLYIDQRAKDQVGLVDSGGETEEVSGQSVGINGGGGMDTAGVSDTLGTG